MYSFDWPWIFILLPLPVLVYFFTRPIKQQNAAALKVPFYQYLHNQDIQQQRVKTSRISFKLLFAFIAWILLLAAAAQPKWSGDPISIPRSGRDLMLAVDISGSMDTKDMMLGQQQVDRLSAIKTVISPFIEQREGDRIGLILFGERAYLQTPLSYDRKTIQQMLYEAMIGLAGEKATAIGDAIGLAVKRLKDLPADQSQSRVLILLTDGSNNAGMDPITAAKLAKQIGIKIYTIGFGADEMIVRSLFGRQRVNPSRDLDEKTLQEIAAATGGRYFRARDTRELTDIYIILDQLEPVESDSFTYRPTKALFFYPLSASFLISLIMLFYLSINRFRSQHFTEAGN
jgi:Ca-activated chloride channel family protein